MRSVRGMVPPVVPCDTPILDGFEDLTDVEVAALVSTAPDDLPDDRATAPAATRARIGPGWRHHTPTPSIPALHIPGRP